MDIQREIQQLKEKDLIHEIHYLELTNKYQGEPSHTTPLEDHTLLNQIKSLNQKWQAKVSLKINNSFQRQFIALIDSGADLNCIRENLIPPQFYESTERKLYAANNSDLKVQYKISSSQICNKGKCFPNTFILTQGISEEMIGWKATNELILPKYFFTVFTSKDHNHKIIIVPSKIS